MTEIKIQYQVVPLDEIMGYYVGGFEANIAQFEYFLDSQKQKVVLKLFMEPVDILLFCPQCDKQHVDKAEPNKCETCGNSEASCICSTFTAWLNPPHKSHRCGGCNHVWKPFNYPTNGVLETSEQSIESAVSFGD